MKYARPFSFYALLLILHSTLTYMCYGGFATSGLNILVPAYAQKNDVDTALLLTANTVAALCGVVGIVVFAYLVTKIGERFVTMIAFVLAGLFGMVAMGIVTSLVGYLICAICTQFFAMGYSQGTTNSLIAKWFPKTKGTILGITTLGLPLASIVITPLLNLGVERRGLDFTVFIFGGILILIGICSRFMLHNTPEEVGCYPENDASLTVTIENRYVSKWTIGRLVQTKETWLLATAFGIAFLITVVYTSQMIPYLIELGFQRNSALTILSVFSIVGAGFSVLTGVLDTKFGTKKASAIFMLWNMAAIFIGIVGKNSPIIIIMSVTMLSCISGGAANLLPSFIISIYGAQDYTAANRVIFTIACIIRAFSFTLIAFGLELTHSYYRTFSATFILALIGFVCILFIRNRKLEPEQVGKVPLQN